ncbi:DUF4153 domain-containing protein [Brevundimonas sp.]|jgi:hypothetical protein|uniref:DUF4153 domain-containing protein n=1 Tax=Brevundimonas sp. TaxID=1871086 RepID=UPI002E0D70D5|nr:DUF4153 domain-containing protein [Brevundimonas sp.]
MSEADVERSGMGAGSAGLAPTRLAVGLAQGLALYALYRAAEAEAWPATAPQLFGPLLLTALFLPVVVLGGLGRLRVLTLAAWTGAAAVLLALVGWHDVARQSAERIGELGLTPFPLPFVAAAIFILHHLIVPADQERRAIASFPRYFDTAWKAGVQLALSIAFTGALWLLLFLGAALFGLIGIRQFGDLLQEPWVAIPLTTVTFSLAVHLTDVRDGLIRGVRSVALMLLSWLLPVIAGLTGAFLVALPFTGLDGLWEQGSATALMLVAAAAIIVLINAAYQDGTPATRPPAALRWAAMIGGLLLVPLVGVATWGLALRIGQHGLTPDRITAAACILVGAVHAGGYALAAASGLRGGPWMKPLERTNIFGGMLAAALIVLLFSPVLDPARLSVMDQTARLARGAVSPAEFDYKFLRFGSGRVGEAALAKLAGSTNAEIARGAGVAQKAESWEFRGQRSMAPTRPIIGAWPEGADLPSDFLVEVTPGDPRWECRDSGACLAEMRDLDGDGTDEVLLATGGGVDLFARDSQGRWALEGAWDFVDCSRGAGQPNAMELMRSGRLSQREPRWPELNVGGESVNLRRACKDWIDTEAVTKAGETVEVELIEPARAPQTKPR